MVEATASTLPDEVWVFSGVGSQFPSGVFSTLDKAEQWIAKHGLIGTLTGYQIDQGAYDWSIQNAFFVPTKPHQLTPEFIGRFSGGQHHHHYEKGMREV